MLLALLVGAALALSGCVMQGAVSQPGMGRPGLLGISSGNTALAVASWLVLPFLRCGADRSVYADAGGVY